MCRSTARRFGPREVFSLASMLILVVLFAPDSPAQSVPEGNTLQTPQVFGFAPRATAIAPSAPQIDPAALVRIPVTVLDDAGRCVSSLSARDFSLSVDGEDSPIAWFRANRATAAALGVLVDISQGMEFKSFSGGRFSQLPLVRAAIKAVVDKLDGHDNVFLASFARRFHMLYDFTSDPRGVDERLPMLRITDQLDDFDGSGIYESMMKAITVLAHAPKTCERRALLVFTNAYCDTSTHGAEDVIARAQFAGVTIYNIIVPRLAHQTDMFSIHNELSRIAAETGGMTFHFGANEESDRDFIASATDEISSELDNQYVLGFPVSQWAPSVLPVELMLPHHPEMRARAPHVVRFRPEDLIREAGAPPSPDLPE